MDEETAKQIRPRLNALRSFIQDVANFGQLMPDDSTRHNYRDMYFEIDKILDDPSFEVFAPPLPHLGTSSDESNLWPKHQNRILDSGRRVIAYLEAQLAELGQGKITKRPLRCFFSYRFNGPFQNYIQDVRRFLELNGVEVVTGERFEPRSVSEKISELLSDDLDFGILLITEDGESMWTRDEVNALWNDEKYVIVLVMEGADFAQGLQGDLEWISFPEGHVSDTFLRLTEGIEFIRKKLESPSN